MTKLFTVFFSFFLTQFSLAATSNSAEFNAFSQALQQSDVKLPGSACVNLVAMKGIQEQTPWLRQMGTDLQRALDHEMNYDMQTYRVGSAAEGGTKRIVLVRLPSINKNTEVEARTERAINSAVSAVRFDTAGTIESASEDVSGLAFRYACDLGAACVLGLGGTYALVKTEFVGITAVSDMTNMSLELWLSAVWLNFIRGVWASFNSVLDISWTLAGLPEQQPDAKSNSVLSKIEKALQLDVKMVFQPLQWAVESIRARPTPASVVRRTLVDLDKGAGGETVIVTYRGNAPLNIDRIAADASIEVTEDRF